jgi:hypothetical protein
MSFHGALFLLTCDESRAVKAWQPFFTTKDTSGISLFKKNFSLTRVHWFLTENENTKKYTLSTAFANRENRPIFTQNEDRNRDGRATF